MSILSGGRRQTVDWPSQPMYTHHKFHVFEGSPPPSTSFAVCAIPRCGSSLLCELLTLSGAAGAPTEFFDRTQMEMFRSAWRADTFDEYLKMLLAKKTSPNGVFGFKVHYSQLTDSFGGRDPRGVFPNLRFIYLKRRNRVRQAVSFAIAMQTNQWASDHDPPADEPAFNREQIDDLLQWIERDERSWELFFDQYRIRPLRLFYEELVSSMESTVVDVLRYLGVELPASRRIGPPTLERQADDRSEHWVARYLELDRA